jgi:transposase-like protein
VPRKGWRCLLLVSEEFRRRAGSLVVDEGVPAARVAKDLGTAESGLRRWVDRHLVEAGRKPGVTGDERDEIVQLRRENRVLRMERDLLSRAAALLATEKVLPRR